MPLIITFEKIYFGRDHHGTENTCWHGYLAFKAFLCFFSLFEAIRQGVVQTNPVKIQKSLLKSIWNFIYGKLLIYTHNNTEADVFFIFFVLKLVNREIGKGVFQKKISRATEAKCLLGSNNSNQRVLCLLCMGLRGEKNVTWFYVYLWKRVRCYYYCTISHRLNLAQEQHSYVCVVVKTTRNRKQRKNQPGTFKMLGLDEWWL